MAGDAAICAALGVALSQQPLKASQNDAPSTVHWRLGELYLHRACQINVTACYGLHSIASLRGCKGNRALETAMFSAACDYGYPRSCTVMAKKLIDGVDVAYDPKRAAKLFIASCNAADTFPKLRMVGLEEERVRDPLDSQLEACVAAARLIDLGFAGDMTEQPAVTPNDALAATRQRVEHSHFISQYEALAGRDQSAWETVLQRQIRDVERFNDAPAKRAADVRAQRVGSIQTCGPLTNAPVAFPAGK